MASSAVIAPTTGLALYQIGWPATTKKGGFQYRLKNDGGNWRWFHSRNKAFAGNFRRQSEIIGWQPITEHKGIEEKAVFISNSIKR